MILTSSKLDACGDTGKLSDINWIKEQRLDPNRLIGSDHQVD